MNFVVGILLLCYLLMWILFVIFLWLKNKPHAVVPQPYPPKDMTPSEVGFIMNRSFSKKLLIADIIDLAHHKMLFILSAGKQYRLTMQHVMTLDCSYSYHDYYQKLVTALFSKYENIGIEKKYIREIKNAEKACEKYVSNHYDLFYYCIDSSITLDIIFIGSIVVMLYDLWLSFLVNNNIPANFIIHWMVLLFFVITIFGFLFVSNYNLYTDKGKQKCNEIYGFKLYLMNRSTNSCSSLQNYPMKTIELYEKYLPYAIALGVEKTWTKQFVHILNIVEKKDASSRASVEYFSFYSFKDFIKNFSQVNKDRSWIEFIDDISMNDSCS